MEGVEQHFVPVSHRAQVNDSSDNMTPIQGFYLKNIYK